MIFNISCILGEGVAIRRDQPAQIEKMKRYVTCSFSELCCAKARQQAARLAPQGMGLALVAQRTQFTNEHSQRLPTCLPQNC